MSDRKLVIRQSTGVNEDHLDLFMDGETGTWRLFLSDQLKSSSPINGQESIQRNVLGSVDFSLEALRKFHAAMAVVLNQIESDPDGFNAEVRSKWDV